MPEDGQKYELVDGEILTLPAGGRHESIVMRLGYLCQKAMEMKPLGAVFGSSLGIRLPNGNVRSPDLTYIRFDNLHGGEVPTGFLEQIPDLVVEVLSPADNMRNVADKIGEYIAVGFPLIWLVNPDPETVTVYRSLTDVRVLSGDDRLTIGEAFPAFDCPAAKLFR